jgi:SEC-C motif-containing protein
LKIGRNEPCWCGSGKKFKKCHLNRAEGERVKHWDISKKQREAFSQKLCMVPSAMLEDCEGKVIRAHTIPKGNSLKAIARNGHVYGFVPSMENLRKNNGRVIPELIGINKASTFSGFCQMHDNQIFSPLEDKCFEGGDEQYFLLGYRSAVKELYAKQASSDLSELRSNLDRGRAIDDQQAIQAMSFLFNVGVLSGLELSQYYKEKLDGILLSRDFSPIKYARISLSTPPDVMVSSGYFPEVDFDGNELQDVADITNRMDMISISSFYGDGRGEVVFTWLDECNKSCEKFVRSLVDMERNRIGDAVVRFMFEACENIYLNPDWWEGLDKNVRASLVDRMMLSATPTAERSNKCLMDDRLKLVDWEILNIETNISE